MQNKQVYDELFDSAYIKVVTTEFFSKLHAYR